MKLHIVSDLHLGRGPCTLPDVGADLLILAGDIHRPAEAIAWARNASPPVLYVPGNHERYGFSLAETRRQLDALSHGSQITVLDCDETCINGVRFLGATLWSDFHIAGPGEAREQAMAEAVRFSHDFSRIRIDDTGDAPLTPAHCAALFEQHRRWLTERLAEPFDGHTVVITHFAPSPGSIAPRFADSPLNACFVSNLDPLVAASGATLWVHGHTHDSFDYRIGDTRVLCNPRGYLTGEIAENPAFDPGLCVTLP
ncbi:metallophosphoesterase family protein [Denitromonas halophila]|uniref:Metallophosphoesterase n=1 Tax=Denitromonas halophila TaxID=1629404 RepID=A0A557QFC1_9RHOO|nr:metallophosphoesterase family protein [Denitromonas halophila]TVO51611.1 metallophosphoesterase [Denitromonas halophila]